MCQIRECETVVGGERGSPVTRDGRVRGAPRERRIAVRSVSGGGKYVFWLKVEGHVKKSF